MAKNEMIKNGEDISLDDGNVTVLNGVSVAEKNAEIEKNVEAEKSVENVETENKNKEVKEDEPIVVSEESKEENKKDDAVSSEEPIIPTIPINDVQPEIPLVNPAPIEFPDISLNNDAQASEQNDFPQINIGQPLPEISNDDKDPQMFNQNSILTFDGDNYGQENNKPDLFGNFNQFGVKNDEPKIPDGIEKALEMVKNEAFEISLENDKLKNENNNLKNENNNLRAEVAKKEAEVSVLKNEISRVQSSMAAAQSRILDVFGMGNLNSQSQKNSNIVNFGDEDVNNNKNFVA